MSGKNNRKDRPEAVGPTATGASSGTAAPGREPATSGDGTGGSSPMKFFLAWFGIPLGVILVLGWMMNHC